MAACPCGSGIEFGSCCEPVIDGSRKAGSPEALMRARYSAFVKRRLSFIEQSIHPKMRHNHDPKSTREWSLRSEWLGLSVVATEGGGPEQNAGSVEFIARYRSDGNDLEHHEKADFRRDDDSWYFFDGKVIGDAPIARDNPKVGRNDPCPCGSGRKYKRCCGA